MKKIVALLLAALMIAAMAMTVMAQDAAPAGDIDIESIEPVTLIATSTRGEQLEGAYIAFLDRVKERSGGRIDYEFYGAGSLVAANETVDALLDGRCDMAMINIANFDSLFPMSANVVSLPFMGMTKEGCDVFGEVTGKYPQILEKEIEGNGLHLISYNMTPAINLCVKSDVPPVSPSDISGKKIIGMSATMLKVIEACGGAPLQVAFPDCYSSLQGGVADGIFQNEGAIVSTGLHEVAPQVVIFQENGGLYFDVAFHCMSKDFWESLSPAAQQIITEEAAALHTEETALRFTDMDRFDGAVKDAGCTVTVLSEEETQAWKELAQPVIDAKVEEITSRDGCDIFKEAYEYAQSVMK